MRQLACPAWGRPGRTVIGDYHYLESGLDHVWLCGIELLRCPYGAEGPLIPKPVELDNFIGSGLVSRKLPLSGKEIRFLRKRLALTGIKFAELLGGDNATLSRWENGKENTFHPGRPLHPSALRRPHGAASAGPGAGGGDIRRPKTPIHLRTDPSGRLTCAAACGKFW